MSQLFGSASARDARILREAGDDCAPAYGVSRTINWRLSAARVVLGLVSCVVGACAPNAFAHFTQLSRATVTVSAANVTAEFQVSAFDLGTALNQPALADSHGQAVDAVLRAAKDEIATYLQSHLQVAATVPCASRLAAPRAAEQYVLVTLTWTCGMTNSPLTYRSNLFQEFDPAARQVVLVVRDGRPQQSLLDARNTELTLTSTPPAWRVIVRYLYAGIEHIFIGYDHIAFLVGVILWARRTLPLLKAVTAFTLAHSVTLALAALDLIRLPSALVEASIALTIVYVAIENYFIRDIERRWRITLVLGLVHGFGFASVLQAYGLPRAALGWALAGFNLGVEIGQLVIVMLAVAVLLVIDRWTTLAGVAPPRRSPRVVYALSGVIGALGGVWLVQRLLLL